VAVMLTLFSAAADESKTTDDFRASKRSREALIQTLHRQLDARGFYKGGDKARASFLPRLQELSDKMDLSERDLVLLQDVLLVISGAKEGQS
jgi:tRNA C32,U32 (ribose-2'-O)-methylase TrmJ